MTDAHDCPRCGYDQTGVVESWRDACPMEGRCSECGLDFEWGDVLNPRLSCPWWSVEQSRRPIRALFATIVVAAWPWVFWRRLRMEHAINGVRLAIVAFVLLFITHGMIAAVNAAAAHREMSSVQRQLLIWMTRPMSNDQVRRHTLRAAAWPYATTRTFRLGPGRRAHATTPETPARFWFPLVGLTLIPLSYLLLGETMRQARVRRAHLVRIWAYSLVVLPLTFLAWRIVDPGPESMKNMPGMLLLGMVPRWLWLVGGSMAAGGVIWWCAVSSYLRLPRSTAVVMTGTAALALFTILVVSSVVLERMSY